MTWGLLYHSSLKIHLSHKLGSFHKEVSKFSHSEQIWGLQFIHWAFLRVTHLGNAVQELSTKYQGQISSNMKRSNMKCSYPNLWKSEKELLWNMYWGLHCHQMLSGKSKNYAISLLYNITQIWQLLSVSTSNIIHLAVI